MSAPYRIMVWGPGRMGSLCIWEISHSPAFELVGVRAYSESKCGVDAGDLVGIAPMGITLTCDVDALLRIDCDCIVYTAHDEGRYPGLPQLPTRHLPPRNNVHDQPLAHPLSTALCFV